MRPRNITEEAERAVQLYDATADTGNEVLDVVLTEKSMHCEARHITLNCVADGSAVTFVEPGDLYALFSNALDQAIDAAARQMDEPRRIIDLLVCKRQGFTVINIISPAVTEAPARAARQHNYELNKSSNPAYAQACISLYNILKPYRGIQNIPMQQETAQIKGMLYDLDKPENKQKITLLHLDDTVSSCAT